MQACRTRCWVVLMIVVTVGGVGVRAESVGCAGLRGVTLQAGLIGLPTTGAEVSSARERHEGGVAYCKVMGSVHRVDAQADGIHFELNLPEQWNGKALQYGGGTFDGYIGKSDGLGRTAMGLKKEATPLMQGYATFGSDGGHHRSYFPLPDAINALSAGFARNAEMQRNFPGDSWKRVNVGGAGWWVGGVVVCVVFVGGWGGVWVVWGGGGTRGSWTCSLCGRRRRCMRRAG